MKVENSSNGSKILTMSKTIAVEKRKRRGKKTRKTWALGAILDMGLAWSAPHNERRERDDPTQEASKNIHRKRKLRGVC